MIRPMVLLVVAFTVGLVLPQGTAIGYDDLEAESHRLYFLSGLPADVPRDAVGELYLRPDGRAAEVTVEEAADIYADRMVKFTKHLDKAKEPWHPRYGVPEYEEPFEASHSVPVAYAGSFALKEFYQYSGSNPTGACNGGQGGHSWLAVPHDVEDERLYPFIGLAHSRVAAYGAGEVKDLARDAFVQDYHVPVYYGGSSDFFCFTLQHGDKTSVLNMPAIIGFVVGA